MAFKLSDSSRVSVKECYPSKLRSVACSLYCCKIGCVAQKGVSHYTTLYITCLT